mmetsp:Transcript_23045/g.71771  ORF Transcript_23045/g.71771 Transcript_23045/m.71771 type:complete len:404 (-) Transcript_23045:1591-2802(-)
MAGNRITRFAHSQPFIFMSSSAQRRSLPWQWRWPHLPETLGSFPLPLGRPSPPPARSPLHHRRTRQCGCVSSSFSPTPTTFPTPATSPSAPRRWASRLPGSPASPGQPIPASPSQIDPSLWGGCPSGQAFRSSAGHHPRRPPRGRASPHRCQRYCCEQRGRGTMPGASSQRSLAPSSPQRVDALCCPAGETGASRPPRLSRHHREYRQPTAPLPHSRSPASSSSSPPSRCGQRIPGSAPEAWRPLYPAASSLQHVDALCCPECETEASRPRPLAPSSPEHVGALCCPVRETGASRPPRLSRHHRECRQPSSPRSPASSSSSPPPRCGQRIPGSAPGAWRPLRPPASSASPSCGPGSHDEETEASLPRPFSPPSPRPLHAIFFPARGLGASRPPRSSRRRQECL